VSAPTIVSALIEPWWLLQKVAEKLKVMVSAKQTRRNKWTKTR
jgi:hypothetical protein